MKTEKIEIAYTTYNSIQELTNQQQELIRAAQKATMNAYAPYSNFHVGAAVLLDNNEIILGNNQENIAYPSGLCAERTALFYAGANYPQNKVVMLAVYAKGTLIKEQSPISPCGSCRQVIAETIKRQNTPFELLLVGENNQVIVLENALDILPFPFGM